MKNQSETLTPATGSAPDLGGGITPESVGTLNLRQEVLEGFLTVRQQHHELQALLHQVMRRVALPRCRAIGEELLRIKAFYPSGKKGPGGHGSRFYSDCKAVTGLSKPSVANYIQIAEGWHRLMDYMADLPENAAPITSLRGALEALRAMNRPELPPRDSGAVDVEAEAIAGDGDALLAAGRKRTSYASSTREKALPALDALMAAATVSDHHKAQLAKVREALALLLEKIEAEEIAAAEEAEALAAAPAQEPVDLPPPAWSEVEPEPLQAPAASAPEATAEEEEQEQAEEEQGASSNRGRLVAMYPRTAEGLADLEAAIAEAGSGPALDRQLGFKTGAVAKHRQRTIKHLQAPAG
jgi:hypothetical protein